MINNRWVMKTLAMLVLAILTSGCAPTVTPEILPTLTPLPTRQATEGGLVILGPEEALRVDAESYAKQNGVTLEEAVKRLQSQGGIGELNAALQANEADTFGGLWIEHEPKYKIVVLFTGWWGAWTIRPYLKDKPFADQVEVRKARYSLAELEMIYAQTIQEMAKLDFEVQTSLDVQGNRVEITVSDREWFESELKRVGAKLPKGAELVAIPGGSTAKNKDLLLTPPVPGIAFPRQKPSEGPRVCMAALMIGTLQQENGCLYVQPLGGDSRIVPVWPPEFTLRVEGDQVLVIGGDGREIVRVGEEIYLGGGSTSADAWVLQQLPPACQGEYFFACEVRSNLPRESELYSLEVIPGPAHKVLFLRYKPALDRQVVDPVSISGKLVSDNWNRCLHVQTDWDTTITLLWPEAWSARLEDGTVVVTDATGQAIARLGDEIHLRGRSIPHSADVPVYRQLINALPGDCVGASWLVDGSK